MGTAVLVTILLITVLRQSCADYPGGVWTDTVYACIRGNNNWQGYASSIAECQEKCEAQSSFKCLSVDYKPGSGTCVNSRYNRNSVRPVDDFTQPCYLPGWQYSERTDSDFKWSETVEACIRLNNHASYTVYSMEECQLKCEKETDFKCLSVDYKGNQCHLSRYSRESIRPTSDYTQPCYVAGFQYAERAHKKFQWSETVEACIRLNNHASRTVYSMEECQEQCEKETSFPCLSVDYKGNQCHLSRYNRESIRPTSDYTQPCYVAGFQYAERVDKKYFWTDTALACIRGNNNERHEYINSLEDCQDLCIKAHSFTCLSVDYKEKDKVCLLSSYNRNSVYPSNDYTQPCYTDPSDWLYAERVNVGKWLPVFKDSCISGNNDWSGDAEDIESCKILCSQRSDCCSVDYNKSTKRCLLSSHTRSSAKFVSPCYGFSYAERHDGCCT